MNKAIENPKQDALLPAIALISLGLVIPPRPTPFPRVPLQTTLEGHIGGTYDSALTRRLLPRAPSPTEMG